MCDAVSQSEEKEKFFVVCQRFLNLFLWVELFKQSLVVVVFFKSLLLIFDYFVLVYNTENLETLIDHHKDEVNDKEGTTCGGYFCEIGEG